MSDLKEFETWASAQAERIDTDLCILPASQWSSEYGQKLSQDERNINAALIVLNEFKKAKAYTDKYNAKTAPIVTAFHVIGPMKRPRVEPQFDGNKLGDIRSGFSIDDDQSIDAPRWLPTGAAKVLGDRYPVDYGRFVSRESCQ